MATVNQAHVRLAKSLHPRLLNFFRRFPPQVLGETSTTSNTSGMNANADLQENVDSTAVLFPHAHNPFRPRRSALSKNWVGPAYSLRRQADLYKLAEKQGVVELLPFTVKSLEERTKKREEQGLRVKGTGVGEMVKGHVRERKLKQRLAKRKTAMKRMPGLIRYWRLVSDIPMKPSQDRVINQVLAETEQELEYPWAKWQILLNITMCGCIGIINFVAFSDWRSVEFGHTASVAVDGL